MLKLFCPFLNGSTMHELIDQIEEKQIYYTSCEWQIEQQTNMKLVLVPACIILFYLFFKMNKMAYRKKKKKKLLVHNMM